MTDEWLAVVDRFHREAFDPVRHAAKRAAQARLLAHSTMTYSGNGPRATGAEIGWRMARDLYLRCVRCGYYLSDDPTTDDEVIAYGMPALRLRSRFLVSYDAYRRHVSLFPASEAVIAELGAEIEPYLVGKGTIRFPAGRPLPLDLVDRSVRIRVTEVEEELAPKGR